MTNIANPAEVKKQEKEVKLKDYNDKSDLLFLLNTPQGRRFIWKWLSVCGTFNAGFKPSDQMFFHEGQRMIGIKMLDEIMRADSSLFVKMQEEAHKK